MKNRLVKGVTLIEVLMVMVIALMILALGLQQYQSYQRDAGFNLVRHDINTVFLSMAKYYWANCNPPLLYREDPCGAPSPTSPLVICPKTPTSSQDPVVIDITTDLINKKFLTLTDLGIQNMIDQKNPTDEDSSPINGYTLQFNLFRKADDTIPIRRFCKDSSKGSICTAGSPTVAMIILWEMQLAIKLKLTVSDSADVYAKVLEAKCVSEYADHCGTIPPPPPPGPGEPAPPPEKPKAKYLIFSRFPPQANPMALTGDNQSNAMIREFKQQYEMQPDWYLATNPSSKPIYYYCGH